MPLSKSPINHPIILDQSAPSSSHTGDTNETVLATYTLPGNLMGIKSMIQIVSLWTHTTSANNKSLLVRFGSGAFLATIKTSVLSSNLITNIYNQNNTSLQIGYTNNQGVYGTNTSGNYSSSVDTTSDVIMNIACVLADAGDIITLESYSIIHYPFF